MVEPGSSGAPRELIGVTHYQGLRNVEGSQVFFRPQVIRVLWSRVWFLVVEGNVGKGFRDRVGDQILEALSEAMLTP